MRGIGNYTGRLSSEFSIIPKGTKLTKITSATPGGIVVKWETGKYGIDGYEIQCAENKNFAKGCVTADKKSASNYSHPFKNLKSGKTYYFRVRTYGISNGKKCYSYWSELMRFRAS